jgi:hypothetical protein
LRYRCGKKRARALGRYRVYPRVQESGLVRKKDEGIGVDPPGVSRTDLTLAPRELFLIVKGDLITVCDKREYVDCGSLPRHIRVIPVLECDASAIRRKSGCCIEVGSRCDSRQRLGLRIDDHECIYYGGRVVVRVILEHGSKKMVVNGMKVKVGVSEWLVRCTMTDSSGSICCPSARAEGRTLTRSDRPWF